MLLADEPTGNLDSAGGAVVLRLLRRLVDDGQTVVMVTHDAGAAALADRVVFLRDGEIVREVAGGDGDRVGDACASSSRPRTRSGDVMSSRGLPAGARVSSLTGLSLRSLRARPLRSLLTAGAIVLGVGMVFGVLLLVGTIHSTFDRLFDSIYGKTDIVVSGEQSAGSLPASTITASARSRASRPPRARSTRSSAR